MKEKRENMKESGERRRRGLGSIKEKMAGKVHDWTDHDNEKIPSIYG